EVQVATSIGEDQLLFRRSETGQAIEKSPYEKAGKASQAALGIANSMGVNVHPSPLVKVSGWLTIDGNSIGMTGGIRPRSYVDWTGTALPAYVILVTAHIAGDYANPWDDIIDDRADVIRYWGDAKHSDRGKTCDAFPGNRCLKAIYDELLVGDRTALPPILH